MNAIISTRIWIVNINDISLINYRRVFLLSLHPIGQKRPLAWLGLGIVVDEEPKARATMSGTSTRKVLLRTGTMHVEGSPAAAASEVRRDLE